MQLLLCCLCHLYLLNTAIRSVLWLLQTGDGDDKVASRSFTEIAAAFLDNSSRKNTAQVRGSTKMGVQQQGVQLWASSLEGSPSVEPRAGRVGVYCHLTHMQRELARPFKVLPATVKRNQLHFGQSVSEWYNSLPRAAKGGRGLLKEQVGCLLAASSVHLRLSLHQSVPSA